MALTEEIIKKNIKRIKASLQLLIKKNDLPFLIETWKRNFRTWKETEFTQVIVYFIDNADKDTKFPRPFELKKIYYNLITEKEIQRKQQAKINENFRDTIPMPEEVKKKLKELEKKRIENL